MTASPDATRASTRSDQTDDRADAATDDGLAVLARLDRPTAPTHTRIAVVADPHLSPDAEGTSKCYHEGTELLRTALADAEARDVDAVVSVGDLTKDGAPREYERVDECLAELDVPFVAVPGNHDVPKPPGDDHETPSVDRFVRRYTPGTLPFHEQVGGLDVVGLNTASTPSGDLTETHDGKCADEQLEWLDACLDDLTDPVVVMHHNTPPMYDQLRRYADGIEAEMGMPPTTRNPEPLVETLRSHDVPLVLTGHLHLPGAADLGPGWELTAPSTCSYPQGYVLLDVDRTGATARYVPVSDADGMAEAHTARRTGGDTSLGLTGFSAVQLASLPLVDERRER